MEFFAIFRGLDPATESFCKLASPFTGSPVSLSDLGRLDLDLRGSMFHDLDGFQFIAPFYLHFPCMSIPEKVNTVAPPVSWTPS